MRDKLIGFLVIILLLTGCSARNNKEEAKFEDVSDILIKAQESYDKTEDEYFVFKGIQDYEKRISELNKMYKPEEAERIAKEYKGELLRIKPQDKQVFGCDRRFLDSFKLKKSSEMLSVYIKYKEREYGETDEDEKHVEYILQLQPLLEDIYIVDDRYDGIVRELFIEFFEDYAQDQDAVEEYVDEYLKAVKHNEETE